MLVNSILLTLLPGLAIAANDWSKPCTSGTCSYESGDGKKTAWSNLVINAESTDALSDITSASGWDIINCDPKSKDPQDIRLVCVDPAKGCSQLFNGGAENTIIRLPEDCAAGPFARVNTTWVDKDQSLPARLAKRGQTTGKVRGLALDFDFSKIPESRGKVYITVAATNSPAQRDAIRPAAVKRSLQPIRHANRRAQAAAVVRDFTSALTKRSPFSISDAFDKVKDGVGNAVDAVKDGVGDAVDTVKDGVGNAVDTVLDGAGQVVDTVKDGVGDVVDTVADGAGQAIDAVENGANQVADTVKDGFNEAVDAAGDALNQAGAEIGSIVDSGTGAVLDFVDSIAEGTRFDKTFNKEFDVANIDQQFNIFDESINCPQQGNVPAFEAGLKVDVGVTAQLTANVGFIIAGTIVPQDIEKLAFTGGLSGDASATFTVGANAKGTFQTPDLTLFEVGLPGLDFPGILAIGPTFSINANAVAELGITADISVTASISLPELQFTFPASEGQSSAQVNPKDTPIKLDVGASATLTGRVEAHLIPRLDLGVKILKGLAEATVFVNLDASAGLEFTLEASASGTPVDGTAGDPNADLSNFDTSFGGSVGMDLGVAINVGAEAALEPFFDQGANFQVFQQTFPIFKKGFGDQARKRSVLTLDDRRLSKRALICPDAGEGSPVNGVVDEVASGTT